MYFGAFYTGDPTTNWTTTAKTYIKEANKQIERRTGVKVREEKIPIKLEITQKKIILIFWIMNSIHDGNASVDSIYR
jgi:hypothetical protein